MTENHYNLSEAYLALWRFVANANYWEKVNDGYLVYPMKGNNKQHLSYEQLDALDPRLRIYLDKVAKHRDANIRGIGVYGCDVDDTVRMWIGVEQILRNFDGQTIAIYSIDKLTVNNDKVVLDCLYKKIVPIKTKINGVPTTIERVSEKDFIKLKINKSWLDETYPGWEQRWLALEALGIPAIERSGQLFVTQFQPADKVSRLPNDIFSNG